MNWNRAFVEALREELPARTVELIDFLADHPGRKFTIPELVACLELDSQNVLNGLLGELTKASKRAGIPQDHLHSWFVLWHNVPEFKYWLSQERADWWNRAADRRFWSLTANPTIYDIEKAVKTLPSDWWATRERKIKLGDRVIIWKSLGGSEQRGIVALGEVVSHPEKRPDIDNSFWIKHGQADRNEERVRVKYIQAPGLPLWLDDPENDFLSKLKVVNGRGTAFTITLEQWEEILIRAGGWTEPERKSSNKGTAWSRKENRIIVAEYFSMLEKELNGKHYSKAESRRKILPFLKNRTKGAVELKYQNISGVLRDQEQPFIQGYKPLGNYQKTLAEEVIRQLNEKSAAIDEASTKEVENSAAVAEVEASVQKQEEISVVFTRPPERSHSSKGEQITSRAMLRNVDYALKEARNKRLGDRGEEFVRDVEKRRLIEQGRKDLTGRVEWVSKQIGDGLGYDIRSCDQDGHPIFIEVKTTTGPETTAFYISQSELQRSRELGKDYLLYRVYNFPKQPRIFVLTGPLDEFCDLEPVSYRAKI
jgi:hypothetical protein